MFRLLDVLILLGAVTLGVMISVVVGGWLVYKGQSAPGERFIGPRPKGQVFAIPEAEQVDDYPEQTTENEQAILKRTERFLNLIGGGK